MMSDHKFWLGLSSVPHIGSVRIQQLIAHFKTAQAAWESSESQLRAAGLSDQPLSALLTTRDTLDLDHEMQRVQATGAHLVTLADPDYPAQLREIADPPAVLYVRGTLIPSDERALAIVGTRRATRYGGDAAQHIAEALGQQGVTIISGLAHGIDKRAHLGALEAGGRTIAVLGCGVDVIYPRDHADLAARIIQNGALISEFPLGMPPNGTNFPRRNRIISGLSLGVLVAEAPVNSGALITVRMALEQGRDVFAIPANIFNTVGAGCNRLIQDGAKLVMTVDDVLNELDIVYDRQQTQVQTTTIAPDNPLEERILTLLDSEPLHVDDIIRLTGLATGDVISTLTVLELKGLAQTVGAMQYCRAR